MVARKTSPRSGKTKAPTSEATGEKAVSDTASEAIEAGDRPGPDLRAEAEPTDTPMLEDSVVAADEPVTEASAEIADPDPTEPQPEIQPDIKDDAPPAPPQRVVERVVEHRGSVLPMIFGGIVTAALGFIAGAGDLLAPVFGTEAPSAVSAQVEQLETRITGVETALSAVDDRIASVAQPDLSPALARIEAVETVLSGLEQAQAGLGAQIADLGARVSDLATRPLAEGASEAAVAAFEAELAGLQSSIAEQRAQVEQMVAEARAMEADAAEQSRRAEIQSALARLVAAIDRGDSLAAEVTALSGLGVDVPQGLTDATDGVPTLDSLQDGFAPAARAALAAARAAGDGNTGVTGWLQKQLGARSVTPRDGDDPDAILSRAGEAVSNGRLADALAELDTLPDNAKAAMADWSQAAQLRLAATGAADALAAQLAAN